MPFTIRRSRRFPVQCLVSHKINENFIASQSCADTIVVWYHVTIQTHITS
jgi:hypothetical protein